MATASLFILASVAAGAVVTDRVATARETRAEMAHPPKGRFVEVDGRRVHAVVEGEGPDLVLIHGANGSLRDFSFDLVDRLKRDYRVIAFDRPGLGWSDRIDASYGSPFAAQAESPQEQAAFLAAAARHLGAERPIVVGHSFGGVVALAWALDHDPAAIVSLAGVANPWPGKLDWTYRIGGTALGGAFLVPLLSAYVPVSRVRQAVDGVFAPHDPPPGYADHMGVEMFVRRGAFRANARQVNTLRPHVVRMAERYGTLTVPIEIVHGDADRSVPLSIHSGPFAERVATANLTVLSGVGHMPHHTNPEDTIAAIDRAASRAGLR